MQAEIRGYFEEEAQDLIDRLTRGAQALAPVYDAADADAANALNAMLRAAHTLKGAAHVVGEQQMAAMAHSFEDVLADYRKDAAPQAQAQLLALTDELAQALRGAPVAPAQPAQQTQPAFAAPAPRVRAAAEETGELMQAATHANVISCSMRALLNRLDALEDTGTVEFRRLKRKELRRDLQDEIDRMERQLERIYRMSAQLQLVSAQTLLLEAGRVLRSTATQLGKQAQCVTAGSEEKLDRSMLDALTDAMLHLVRNALAHGVESRAERVAQGKAPVATVTVSLGRQGSDIVLRCQDDGRGIAPEQVRAAAIAQGRLPIAEAETISAQDVLALLLLPGFSLSADAVNQVSGRGVGLDAVRAAAERLGGQVTLTSEPGQGTAFAVIVPQRQFAMEVLQVSAGGRRHALPLASVAQTFVLQSHHTLQLQGARSLLVGGVTMPYFALHTLLPESFVPAHVAAGAATSAPKIGVVVRASAGQSVVLGADRVEAIGEVLVHPLPASLQASALVAGAAITADGTPQLMLNPAALLNARPLDLSVRKQPASSAPLPLLVIDDSLTTRMLEQSILQAEGFTVEVATSAEQGLQMARATAYALFLVDVEMPGMNGYEFVSTVTADPQLQITPCIMVTSLDSAESRERGRMAGAFSYIVKGEFNQAIYLERIRSAIAQNARDRAANWSQA